jgi:hypothetical protein
VCTRDFTPAQPKEGLQKAEEWSWLELSLMCLLMCCYRFTSGLGVVAVAPRTEGRSKIYYSISISVSYTVKTGSHPAGKKQFFVFGGSIPVLCRKEPPVGRPGPWSLGEPHQVQQGTASHSAAVVILHMTASLFRGGEYPKGILPEANFCFCKNK